MSYDFLCKCITIGNTGVGKTSLLRKYMHDEYAHEYVSTIGVDFYILTGEVKDKIAKIQLWDTAGQERFRTIVSTYYRGVNLVLFVYDVTNKQTLYDLVSWKEDIDQYCKTYIPICFANKSDLGGCITDEDIEFARTKLGVNEIQLVSARYSSQDNLKRIFAKKYEDALGIILHDSPKQYIGSSQPIKQNCKCIL